jgi:L-threonylcarbamoyladenylate synthase
MNKLGAEALPFWSAAEIESSLGAALLHLRSMGILAYPTETVYGLGGGLEREAVQRLVAFKRRPPFKPFLLLIAGAAMLERLDLHLTKSASRLAARFWPGPLTLVLPGGERRVPDLLRGPEGGVAVRWTPHPGLQRLIAACGDALTSTSANRPGEAPAVSARQVLDFWLGDVRRGQLLVLDGGRLEPSLPSTVVDCTGPRPRVIRPGAIAAPLLREAAPDLVGDS